MSSRSTHLEDVNEIEQTIRFMRQLIADQLVCYEKIRSSHAELTPNWTGTIRSEFEQKIDDFLNRTKIIQNDSEMLFTWADKYIALAHEREDIMH